MLKQIMFSCACLAALSASAQKDTPWWLDPEVNEVNTMPPRAAFFAFETEQLAQEGWAVWSATQLWEDASSSYQLLSQLSYSQENYVEAVCSSGNLSSLSSAFGSLTGSNYQLLQTTAPAL